MAETKLKAHDLESTPIPQGLVAWWLGTYGSVPDGWEIADGNVAANDSSYTKPSLCHGRFPKGDSTVGTTGGSTTHTHGVTASSHSHTINAGGNDTHWGGGTGDSWDGAQSHTHNAYSASVGALNADASEPANVEAIPIVFTLKPGGTGKGLPRNHDYAAAALTPWKIVMAWAGGTPPGGWSLCDGSTVNSVVTPNLVGKYLRGIPTTGTTPGSSLGASSHSHTVNHSHVSGGSLNCTNAAGWDTWYWISSCGHAHTSQVTNVNSDSASSEPPYTTVKYLCFTGHGSGTAAHSTGRLTPGDLAANLAAPRGLVAAYVHSGGVPSEWAHCDGAAFANGNPTGYSAKPNLLAKFLKHVANATTNGGTAAGADTHGHTGGSHTHSTTAKTGGNIDTEGGYDVAVASTGAPDYHTHTLGTITWSGNMAGKSTNEVDHKPPYVEVAWIVRD